MPDTDDGGDDADLEAAAFEPLALLDMRLEVSDMPAAFSLHAPPSGKTHVAQRFPHGSIVVAIACGVDVRLGHAADIRPAAEKAAEMAFLIAPCRDFNGAIGVRIGIDNAGRFEGIYDAKRPIKPAGEILAFEMRPGQQFWSGFRACAEYIADAVDISSEPCLG
jgi:hypothetical protein